MALLASLRSMGVLHSRMGVRHMSAPKVTDYMVALTAFTEEGSRVPVLGRVGTTLAETLSNSAELAERMPGAVQNMSPSETVDCHVSVSSEYAPLVPALTAADKEWLEYEIGVPGSVGDSSRMASKIVLNSEMNGMTVRIMHSKMQNRN